MRIGGQVLFGIYIGTRRLARISKRALWPVGLNLIFTTDRCVPAKPGRLAGQIADRCEHRANQVIPNTK